MNLVYGECVNFGSYGSMTFNYVGSGLTLVYGPTGSGKSTFQDLPFWVLFGQTAKDGVADDIRSWTNTEEPTVGELTVQLPDGTLITVTRIRGSAHENDLYWIENDSEDKIRGKDATETQKLLSKRLGVSADLYATASYYSEFSPSAAFFLSPAKAKRALFEKIASLDLPVKLAAKVSEAKKEAKTVTATISTRFARAEGKVSQLLDLYKRNVKAVKEWSLSHAEELSNLRGLSDNFDLTKLSRISALTTKLDAWDASKVQKLTTLTEKFISIESNIVSTDFDGVISELKQKAKCKTCGSLDGKTNDLIQEYLDDKAENNRLKEKLQNTRELYHDELASENPYYLQIQQENSSINSYMSHYELEAARKNPFDVQAAELKRDLDQALNLKEFEREALEASEHKYASLDQLYDLSFDLRGELLKNAVSQVEQATNRYLEAYFDAEIRVSFSIEGSDDLTTLIYKSGYQCNYKQLSKGQRGLLKLCFGVAMMKAAANNAGVHFHSLFFDESLDGMDNNLKLKAFRLFQELESEHGSCFVIDHAPDFQNMFARRYAVSMDSDLSTIELQNDH